MRLRMLQSLAESLSPRRSAKNPAVTACVRSRDWAYSVKIQQSRHASDHVIGHIQ
jgi:hypothetical protein